MQRIVKSLMFFLIMSALIKANAQETIATLSGRINDSTGNAITGASIIVKHNPTGRETKILSNNKGIFVLTNLKAGGPYTLTASFVGFKEEVINDINLTLGTNPDLNIILQPVSNELKEVTIMGTGRRNLSSGLTVGARQLSTLPTLGRSLQDFTRLTPQSNNNSFAGTSFRYNNITLDGAVNNDAIGFSNSAGGVSGGGQAGTSGSGTRTNPYSLDAIQEVQVQLAPYDVRLGNFTGGSINAVTKSGANDFHGSVYGYGRNQTLVGKSNDALHTKIGSDFYDYQYGASVGGPIIKNKAFFFVNGEITRRQEPTFYNAGDAGAAISVADAEAIRNNLITKYNYDPGTYGPYTIATNSNKLFGRFDWNLNLRNSLMLRAIYTHGWGQNLERSSTNFQFSSTDFTQHTKNLNLVAELKSTISNSVSNNIIASYINVHEYRDFPGVLAPFIDIGGGKIWLGTWREASVYNVKQKTVEFTDNLTVTKGINKFTFGTHNEFYDLTYGFLNSWNGRWEYADVNSFLADKPSRIRSTYSVDDSKNSRNDLYNNLPGSNYKVNLLSAYAQDDISFNKKFKLTPGIRVDYSFVNNQPPLDTAVTNTKDYISTNPTYTHTSWSRFDNKWLGKATVSPRVGFSYDVNGNQSLIFRGGTGVFVGRMPFAWLGYAYTLNGTNFGNIDYKPVSGTVVPLAINPNNLQDTVTKYGGTSASATHEVDIIDNNFKLPSIWRSNLATDIKFGRGYKLTLDVMYTKTLHDVKFQQINVKDTTAYFSTGLTQTPVYVGGKVNAAFSNAYLLSNTTEGYRYNLTAQISKAANNIKVGSEHLLDINWSLAYTYGISKDISNGIRNSFQSNYEVNPSIVPNDPQLAYSNFDLRHRIVGTGSFAFKWNSNNTSSLALFYSSQSGSPYTLIYASSPNPFSNASNANLVYIPKDRSDINLADIKDAGGNVTVTADQQWTAMNNFITSDDYLSTRRGKYTERNGMRTPWNHFLDMKLMHEFHFKGDNDKHSLQVSLDIFNVLNLVNNDWGHIAFVTNVNNYNVNFLKFATDANSIAPGAPSTGYVPTFNFVAPPSTGHYYTIDPINSRWQAQVGVKYNF